MSAPPPMLPALLGSRQAEIMQRLWLHGAATVRELHTWLIHTEPLAYTTVMTTCVRLWEKGLLDRRQVTEADAARHHGKAYLYTPRLTEVEFLRAATTSSSDPPYPQLEGIPQHDAMAPIARRLRRFWSTWAPCVTAPGGRSTGKHSTRLPRC
jgi:predicted transcriptional regulator